MLDLTLAVQLALLVSALFIFPGHIGPPELDHSKDIFQFAKTIPLPGEAAGPESLAFDNKGEGPYTGVLDGRILKWQGEDRGWTEFATTSPNRNNCIPYSSENEPICGRPLGLHFERKSGDLYIADAYFGVMKVGPEGGLAEIVVDKAEGRKDTFTNHLDIDEEQDIIYFVDSSDKYQFRTLFNLILSGDNTGRVIQYNRKTKEAKVLMDGFRFPNGVTCNKNYSFVLVAESASGLIHRYWVKGPKAGTHDIFAEVPGYPDNIIRTETGEFWVALHAKKSLFPRIALSNSSIGQTLIDILKTDTVRFLFEGGQPHGVAVKLSETGEILEILEDSAGKTVQMVSEVQQKDGKLWLGSVYRPSIWVMDYKNDVCFLSSTPHTENLPV